MRPRPTPSSSSPRPPPASGGTCTPTRRFRPTSRRGENPPDGAIIDYAFKSDVAGPVTLEILDGAGKVIRRYASTDPVETLDPLTVPVPIYWYRPPQVLRERRGASLHLGHAPSAARRRRRPRRPSDLRDAVQHGPDAELDLGRAGNLYGEAHRGGENLCTAADAAARSAGEDAAGRDRPGLRDVQGPL